MIPFAEVSLGSGGRAGCVRCDPGRDEPVYRPVLEITADVDEICETWQGRLGPNIRLTGVEPFGHPELSAVVSSAVAAGCERIGVDTDGAALSSERAAAAALTEGIRHVRFTLLGGSAALHDALAGSPGHFDATVEGVRSYKAVARAEAVAVSITALVPVCRHNLQDLPMAVLTAIECGAKSVLLRLEDGGIEMGSLTPWVMAACDTGVVNSVWVEVEGIPFCRMPGYDLHVSDTLRPRQGSKAPGCDPCALGDWCGGSPAVASAGQLAGLAAPPFAATLAASVARARCGEGD